MGVVKFGVIGVGGIGRTHMESVRKAENAELSAVADINEAIGRERAEQFNVKWYADYEEMMEKEEIDAVTVCTPHFLHAPMTVYALKQGKHVLCEKPMALHVQEADEMIDAAEKTGSKLGVISIGRTEPAARWGKNLIERGELGRIYRAEMLQCGIRTGRYYKRATWRGTWSMEGGGSMCNQAIHIIDLLPWYLGEPRVAYGWIANKVHQIEVEDAASAIIIFEDNVPAILQSNNIEVPPADRIELVGNKGRLRGEWRKGFMFGKHSTPIKEFIQTTPNVWGYVKAEWSEFKCPEGWSAHLDIIKDFAEAILEDRDPAFTGYDGRTSLEIINAITLSFFKGSKVVFPVDREEYVDFFEKLKSREVRLTKFE